MIPCLGATVLVLNTDGAVTAFKTPGNITLGADVASELILGYLTSGRACSDNRHFVISLGNQLLPDLLDVTRRSMVLSMVSLPSSRTRNLLVSLLECLWKERSSLDVVTPIPSFTVGSGLRTTVPLLGR